MSLAVLRPARLLLPALTLLAVVPVAAQQRDAASGLPPHVRAQLWPERELSPAEAELKSHVVVLRDTLAPVEATGALFDRQQRGNAGAAVLRSTTRRMVQQCTAAGRAGAVMREYAGTIRTDNERWGEVALREFRAGIDRLVPAMERCATRLGEQVANPDAEVVRAENTRARAAIREYENGAAGLINTLRIPLDPRGSGRN